MARPPFARRAPHTAGEPPAGKRDLDVLPHAYADFLAMERELASTELGFPVVDEASARGDLAGTVMEMSALVAHVLALYTDRYGNEAFLGTAASPASLVKHGRRLAYEPSPGVTASGYLALFVKESLEGTIPARFAFASGAVGEKPAQDYELIEDADVAASMNVIFPRDAVESITGGTPATITLFSVVVAGVGLGLEIGDVVCVTWGLPASFRASARFVKTIAENEETGETTVGFAASVTVPYAAEKIFLVAKPEIDVHAFGHDAPAVFDGASAFFSPASVQPEHVFLDRELDAAVGGEPIVYAAGQAIAALRLEPTTPGFDQSTVHVKLRHTEPLMTPGFADPPTNSIPIQIYSLTPEVFYARTVTRLVMRQANAAAPLWARPAIADRHTRYLSQWGLKAEVRTWRHSTVPVTSPIVLTGEHPAFLPGHLFALEAINDDAGEVESRIARVRSATILNGTTTVTFSLIEPGVTLDGFRLGHVRVLGNVAKVSHGKTVTEVLGDSDGVSAFHRLRLAKTPVAYDLTATGSEPQLEVRVGGAAFRRAVDFEDARTTDPVYLTERDDTGVVSVVFGDGAKGAIPPSGKRHVQAVYRKGIGRVGNADALAVNKIAKAHPILESAYNPVPIAGGVEPASSEDVRAQAPLYLATFDRAVSVADHAKLALRCPGVVRAHAILGEVTPGVEGVIVVIADRDGAAPNAESVRVFLRERRDNTLPFKVVPPGIVDVALTIGVVFDPAFDEEMVKLTLRGLLTSDKVESPGLLTFGARDLGQPLFMSQIVEWVERLPGIVAFRVLHFSVLAGASNPPAVPPATLDTVRADPNEWIRLLSQNLVIDKIAENV